MVDGRWASVWLFGCFFWLESLDRSFEGKKFRSNIKIRYF